MWKRGAHNLRREALICPRPLPAQQYRGVEFGFHQPGPRAPNVELATAARLKQQEHGGRRSDQDQRQRQRRGCLGTEHDRQRDPGPSHGPVGGHVKAVAPDQAAIDFAAKRWANAPIFAAEQVGLASPLTAFPPMTARGDRSFICASSRRYAVDFQPGLSRVSYRDVTRLRQTDAGPVRIMAPSPVALDSDFSLFDHASRRLRAWPIPSRSIRPG